MGRRTLIALAVAALPLGVAVAPASARSKRPFIIAAGTADRTHVVKPGKALPLKMRMDMAFGPAKADSVLYDGYRAECAAPAWPNTNGPAQTFYSSDTFEWETAGGDIVETCTANLNSTDPFNGALGTNGQPIAYSTQATTWFHATSCGEYAPNNKSVVLLGTGYAVVYENGLYTLSCVVKG